MAESEEEPPAEPQLRDTPDDICLEAAANAIALHPERELLAAGDVDGDVYLYSYCCVQGNNRQLWSSGHHLKSCRDVAFSQDGHKLLTVAKDKAVHVLAVENGRLETRIAKAHGAALNCVLPVDQHLLATGDDNGELKVWDLRKGGAVLEARQHEEYISAMAVDGAGKILLTASGDGTMGVFNIKRRRFELLSEPQSGDLTSVVLLKRGKKVACGSSEGTIYLFNWNGFGATSDRFSLRAESVDCMVPVTESIVCTGSLDGVIRAVNILPNRVLGCVGQHLGEPIEQLAVAPGGQLLASCAHDQKVKFWDISSLGSMVVDEYRKKKKRGGPLKALSSKAAGSGEDFFADLREEQETTAEAATGSDSDDSD
ncbi:WD repeat-containing protein 55 [Tympanuchus pallidicinctus]|uniref:WD repeat-containing protein 55 n=1 Tax=Tympanuchus pallidicinctus TaxID=109042 RepID=UPI002286CE36|nr:WD repeat-containing protein 55 [Tympanuchus pallidicinctus]